MIAKLNNTSVFYTDEGNGKTIVLLHGFLENSNIWKNITPQLTKYYRIICIDLLGHGQTGCIANIHHIRMHAEAVSTVLIKLNINKATIIGHSMGGYVALAFAELFSNTITVDGLCLINSTSRADSNERKATRERIIGLIKKNHNAYVSMAISNLFNPKTRTDFATDISILKQNALTIPPEALIASVNGMKLRKDRSNFLTKYNYKKLMLIGKEDYVLEHDTLIEECKKTNTEYIILKGGHMSYIEDKDGLIASILKFMD